MSPQCRSVLAYLMEHKTINPLESWERLGIYRLGARVFELRQRGHDIFTYLTPVTNRWGRTVRVAVYHYRSSAEKEAA